MGTPLVFLLFLSLAFAGQVRFSPDYTADWNIDSATSTISFKLNVSKIAWVSIGWHPVGSATDDAMVNADIIVATFNASGLLKVGDYFSQAFSTPNFDTDLGGRDDVLTPAGSQINGRTIVTFTRRLVTGDIWDEDISIGPMNVIWAIGTSQTFAYHGMDDTNRGSQIVSFFPEDTCGPTTGCTPCVSKPKCVFCADDNLCYDKTNTGKCSQLNSTCTSFSKVTACPTNALPNAYVPDGYCASIWVASLASPRGITTASNGDILVVEARRNQVTVFWTDTSGAIRQNPLAAANGINHGIAISNDFLYASNPTTVFRWKYQAGQRNDLGPAEIVINNVPCCHHTTRTITFDKSGNLYVTVGSGSNVDPDSTHARVRQFNVQNVPSGGINWNSGVLYADGLRNEVGIAFDDQDRLWGVENGCDDLNRDDLGGDIHTDNPSEEVNLFSTPGLFYGYPYCWSEYNLPTYGRGKGTQWVHPDFMNDGIHSDAWCRNTTNVVLPVYNIAAHQAPLDIKFYYGNDFPGFPSGGAFVSLHGSWNRQPPVGYRVLYLTFSNGLPTGEIDILRHAGSSDNWPNNVRPVGITFNTCYGQKQCMYVTSDGSGQIIEISYQP